VSAAQDKKAPTSSKASPPLGGRTEVRALARLLPESGLIAVGARPGARVEAIKVKAGDTVSAGDVLAVLEGHAEAQAQLALAEEQKRQAEFDRKRKRDELALERESFDEDSKDRLDVMKKMIAEQTKNLNQLAATRAALANPSANTSWVRLADQDYVMNQVQVDILKLDAQYKELNKKVRYLPRQRAIEDRELADDNPAWALLDRKVALTRAHVDQALIKAPGSGEVLDVLVHEGEISSGPLLYVGDLSAMTARAEVYQQDAGNVLVGDAADVFLFGRGLPGEVVQIGKVVLPNQITSLEPTARVDRRVVAVTVRLKDPSDVTKYVNMQVEVAIRPSASRPK
jgi:HlyD family secretion protein